VNVPLNEVLATPAMVTDWPMFIPWEFVVVIVEMPFSRDAVEITAGMGDKV
jgi:hypothetical protein